MRKSLGRLAGWVIVTAGLVACGLTGVQDAGDPGELAGEAFVDAFYSWNPQRLEAQLVVDQAGTPTEQVASALYYQAWAEAGNYRIQTRRPCERQADGRVACAITVTDDLGRAMGYVATDTFWLRLAGPTLAGTAGSGTRPQSAGQTPGQIVGVTFTADDPPVFKAVMEWLQATRPEVFTGPCEAMFAGGTTPADCVRAVVAGAQDYMRTNAGQH